MPKITVKKRHVIRKSQISELLERLTGEIGGASADLFRSDRIERVETDAPVGIYLVDKKPLLMGTDDWTFPTCGGVSSSTLSPSGGWWSIPARSGS